MNPEDYERLAPSSELDREPDESERAQQDSFDEGYVSDDGGELGRADWEDALALARAVSEIMAG